MKAKDQPIQIKIQYTALDEIPTIESTANEVWKMYNQLNPPEDTFISNMEFVSI